MHLVQFYFFKSTMIVIELSLIYRYNSLWRSNRAWFRKARLVIRSTGASFLCDLFWKINWMKALSSYIGLISLISKESRLPIPTTHSELHMAILSSNTQWITDGYVLSTWMVTLQTSMWSYRRRCELTDNGILQTSICTYKRRCNSQVLL